MDWYFSLKFNAWCLDHHVVDCKMLINFLVIVNRPYSDKWILDDAKCLMLDCSIIPSLQANNQNCVDSVDATIWRMFKFH